ncbi:hypothetical protein TPAU25S_00939 [Tsukamurella paurometabola]
MTAHPARLQPGPHRAGDLRHRRGMLGGQIHPAADPGVHQPVRPYGVTAGQDEPVRRPGGEQIARQPLVHGVHAGRG